MLLLVLLPGNGNAKIKTFYKLRVVCGQEEGATLNVLRIALHLCKDEAKDSSLKCLKLPWPLMKIGFLHSILDGMFIELSCCWCCCGGAGNRLNNLNIKIVSNLHAPPAAATSAAPAAAAAATWLTTATIANQIKQLSCYELERGRLEPHQVARLTNKRELRGWPEFLDPWLHRIMATSSAWCFSSLPIKIYKNSSHLVLAKTAAYKALHWGGEKATWP